MLLAAEEIGMNGVGEEGTLERAESDQGIKAGEAGESGEQNDPQNPHHGFHQIADRLALCMQIRV